jgi:hypothetical protein
MRAAISLTGVVAAVVVGVLARGALSAQPPAAAATPRPSYTPFDAAEDARRMSEAEGQAAVTRQVQLLDDIRWRNMWAPYVEQYAAPFVAAYGPPWAGRRAYRDWAPLPAPLVYPPLIPWARGPSDFFGQPYVGQAQQPIGHEKIWTGPNGYIYRPKYADPPVPSQPTPAAPRGVVAPQPVPAPTPNPPTSPSVAAPPADAAPEVIPTPPAQRQPAPDGPREF